MSFALGFVKGLVGGFTKIYKKEQDPEEAINDFLR